MFWLAGAQWGGSACGVAGALMMFEAGAVMADDLTPQKARILLMLLLQSGISDQKGLQAAFSK